MRFKIIGSQTCKEPPVGVFLSEETRHNEDVIDINLRIDGEDFRIAWIDEDGFLRRMRFFDRRARLQAAGIQFDGDQIAVK